jgi:ketosteroid isomerase-like protein
MNSIYDTALKLFKKQIECIINDDKTAQMKLYAENLHYEFPFANDRPRIIEGREAFYNVMMPLWNEARKKGVKVTNCKHEFHATDENDLFVAIFNLDIIAGENMISLPFVQLIRIKDDLIVEIREYTNSAERKEIAR